MAHLTFDLAYSLCSRAKLSFVFAIIARGQLFFGRFLSPITNGIAMSPSLFTNPLRRKPNCQEPVCMINEIMDFLRFMGYVLTLRNYHLEGAFWAHVAGPGNTHPAYSWRPALHILKEEDILVYVYKVYLPPLRTFRHNVQKLEALKLCRLL